MSGGISVIVVAYNSESSLAACLGSIPPSIEVIVIDQESSDRSIDVAKQSRDDIILLRAGANRGFGAGCNLGAANAHGEILIFLNPDAVLHPWCAERLGDAVKRTNAIVGPAIFNKSGRAETRARYWSGYTMEFLDVIWPQRPTFVGFSRDIPPSDSVYRTGGVVPYIQGSCIALRAEAFWSVGGFDEQYFLYYEEEVLARRLSASGVQTLLEPSAQITHIGGVSTAQTSDFSIRQLYRSKALFYRNFLGRKSAWVPGGALWLLLHLMALATPLRLRVGLRSDRDGFWFRSAAAGLIDGWRRRIVVPPQAQRSNCLP